ncbi:MAG TPA: ferredoxin [Spirochaetes bacterium]|nr:ferredoxin [Spirochaetota bacterium]
MKVSVDPDECTACGLCSDDVPDVFALDDDDEVVKVLQSDVPADLEDEVKQAAEDCPSEAIKLE